MPDEKGEVSEAPTPVTYTKVNSAESNQLEEIIAHQVQQTATSPSSAPLNLGD